MACFAQPVIGRAFARPVGSQLTEKIANTVIPGREAKRSEPGIHPTAIIAAQWIPGSRSAPRNDEEEAHAGARIPE
jgi:hypothetical protein